MNDARGSDARSVDMIRRLVARKLVDRAVLLGEARWPGSGPLIRLAAWPELAPNERAARLEAIGPEALGQLRSLAEMQPDLSAVLAELEAHRIVGSAGTGEASRPAEAETGEVEPAILAQPAPQPLIDAATEPVEAATIDLPPASEILAPMVDDAAIAEAAAMLERVHARVQRSIDRAAEASFPSLVAPVVTTAPAKVDDGGAFGADVLSRTLTRGAPEERLAGLRRVAESAGLSYVEVDAAKLSRGDLYGRLVRVGSGVETEVGALPRAVARPGLVAFVGRLPAWMSARIEEGYCDIPGTNATVRVHPECRVVVVDAG